MKDSNKKNPFKTPEGYFEDLSGKLMGRIFTEDKAISEDDGFIVPEGYFEGLHKNIRQKLDTKEPKIILLHPFKKYLYAAASIAAIVLVVFTLNRKTSQEISFDDITNSDIENYFAENGLDFSTYEIAQVVPVDELEIADILSNGFKEDIILNYIDNNTDNFEELNVDYDD